MTNELPETIEEMPRSVAEGFEPRDLPPRVGDVLDLALLRARRRRSKKERPLPLPWPEMARQFGGGLWPGVHVLVGATGSGKTAWALQIALHAARAGFPVGYVGLELEEMQVALRLLGETAAPPVAWSRLYLGEASDDELERADHAKAALAELPLYLEMGPPSGWPTFELHRLVEAMRTAHPEPEGPGSAPMLLVLDFLQLVGDEADLSRRMDLRERIGRAAYFARDIARRYHVAVVLISSAARDKYSMLAGEIACAGLSITFDETKHPSHVVDRPILRPDTLVGLGKESGEIEYSADSVTVAIRWPEPRINVGTGTTSVIFATAKGRAMGSQWCELRFNGHRFAASHDQGRSLACAIQEAGQSKKGASNKPSAPDLNDLATSTVVDPSPLFRPEYIDPLAPYRIASSSYGNGFPQKVLDDDDPDNDYDG